MSPIRQPAVAGRFYPGDPRELKRALDGYLNGIVPQIPPPNADCPTGTNPGSAQFRRYRRQPRSGRFSGAPQAQGRPARPLLVRESAGVAL